MVNGMDTHESNLIATEPGFGRDQPAEAAKWTLRKFEGLQELPEAAQSVVAAAEPACLPPCFGAQLLALLSY